jgi:hypothetical protein
MDDNFSTIIIGIQESRKLFDNLRKAIQFYLACKLALVALFLACDLSGLAFPFAPIQVIVLEMFMDLGASSTFIMEPAEADVLNRPPRNPKESLLNMSFNLWVISGIVLTKMRNDIGRSSECVSCSFDCIFAGRTDVRKFTILGKINGLHNLDIWSLFACIQFQNTSRATVGPWTDLQQTHFCVDGSYSISSNSGALCWTFRKINETYFTR